MTVSKGDDSGKEREADAGQGGEGEQPCCDAKVFLHGHPRGAAFMRGLHRVMHGAGAGGGPASVQINIVVPEDFSCCAPAQDCCVDDECCSEEQPAAEK